MCERFKTGLSHTHWLRLQAVLVSSHTVLEEGDRTWVNGRADPGGVQEGHVRTPRHGLVERERQKVLSGSTGSNKRLPDNSPYN